MAVVERDQVFKMKNPYDSSSKESTANPEAGLIREGFSEGYGDTQNDLADMQRLGKKQEFKVRALLKAFICQWLTLPQRNFSLLATLGFISIYMATWEFVLVYVTDWVEYT